MPKNPKFIFGISHLFNIFSMENLKLFETQDTATTVTRTARCEDKNFQW